MFDSGGTCVHSVVEKTVSHLAYILTKFIYILRNTESLNLIICSNKTSLYILYLFFVQKQYKDVHSIKGSE